MLRQRAERVVSLVHLCPQLRSYRCLAPSVCASISVCTSQCVHLSVCASLSVCVSQCVHLSVCAPLSVCVSQCVRLSVCTSQCVHLSVCAPISGISQCVRLSVCTSQHDHLSFCAPFSLIISQCVFLSLCTSLTVCLLVCCLQDLLWNAHARYCPARPVAQTCWHSLRQFPVGNWSVTRPSVQAWHWAKSLNRFLRKMCLRSKQRFVHLSICQPVAN